MTWPTSSRHCVRNTMAMLCTIVRRSAEHADDTEAYAAHLDGRLSTLMCVHGVTDTFGEADLHTLISNELMFHLVRKGERATIAGPRVRLRPRAALALLLHELASNAVEHGSLALPRVRVSATGRVEPTRNGTPMLALDSAETGGRGVREPIARGFGTDVLEELLTYDLGAYAALSYEPDGLCCGIRLPLTFRTGRVEEPEKAGVPSDTEIN